MFRDSCFKILYFLPEVKPNLAILRKNGRVSVTLCVKENFSYFDFISGERVSSSLDFREISAAQALCLLRVQDSSLWPQIVLSGQLNLVDTPFHGVLLLKESTDLRNVDYDRLGTVTAIKNGFLIVRVSNSVRRLTNFKAFIDRKSSKLNRTLESVSERVF